MSSSCVVLRLLEVSDLTLFDMYVYGADSDVVMRFEAI